MRKIVLSILIVLLGMVSGIVYGQENADKGAYSFGGHVFSGDFPISLGYAFLYDYNNDLNLIDTAVIDTLGYYYFYRVPEGEYLVKAGVALPKTVLIFNFVAKYTAKSLALYLGRLFAL
jgi:hypothetical protein